MVVALMLPRFLGRLPDRPFMLVGGVVLGIGLLLGLTDPGLLALLPVWFVLGAGSSLIQTPAGRLLKRSAHKGDRPAIYAAHFALLHACWLLAYPLAGWIGATLGLTVAFTVLAFVVLTSTAAALALWPAHDPVEVEHLHEALEHGHLQVHDEHHQHAPEGWEGQEPHRHPHRHAPLQHKHPYVVDLHHQMWPSR